MNKEELQERLRQKDRDFRERIRQAYSILPGKTEAEERMLMLYFDRELAGLYLFLETVDPRFKRKLTRGQRKALQAIGKRNSALFELCGSAKSRGQHPDVYPHLSEIDWFAWCWFDLTIFHLFTCYRQFSCKATIRGLTQRSVANDLRKLIIVPLVKLENPYPRDLPNIHYMIETSRIIAASDHSYWSAYWKPWITALRCEVSSVEKSPTLVIQQGKLYQRGRGRSLVPVDSKIFHPSERLTL